MTRINLDLKHWLTLNCPQESKNTKQNPTKINTRIFLGDKFPGIYFTKREAQCAYQLLQQKKRKEISAVLGLSIRTVEAYITEAKVKTKSHSQKELIEIIKKTDFVSNYLEMDAVNLHTGTTPLQPVVLNNHQWRS